MSGLPVFLRRARLCRAAPDMAAAVASRSSPTRIGRGRTPSSGGAARRSTQIDFRRVSGDHGFTLMLRLDDRLAIPRKHFPKLAQIEAHAAPRRTAPDFFPPDETGAPPAKTPAMFRMGRMLELLLQMHKRARGLDQALEIMRIVGRDRLVQPNLLENVVRFVVTLLVPALEKGRGNRDARQSFRPRQLAPLPLRVPGRNAKSSRLYS